MPLYHNYDISQYFSATQFDTWEEIDLSSYGVPPGAIVEIVIKNDRGSGHPSPYQYDGGVRAVGSSLQRRLPIQAAYSPHHYVCLHVQANSESKIEVYADYPDYIDFHIAGWWTRGTYVEKWQDLSPGVSDAWAEVNLSSYGVASGNVCEFNTSTRINAAMSVGVRGSGSTLDRRVDLHDYDNGYEAVTMLAQAGESGIVEIYEESQSSVDTRLAGYWSTNPGEFTELSGIQVRPSGYNVWEGTDVGASGLPDPCVFHTLLGCNHASSYSRLGVRPSGSSTNRYLDIAAYNSVGGVNWAGWHTNLQGSNIELWGGNPVVNGELLIWSYFAYDPFDTMDLFLAAPEFGEMDLFIAGGSGLLYGDDIYHDVAGMPSFTDGNTAWEVVDLTPHGVPPNVTLELLMVNTRSANPFADWYRCGVREVGSSFNRYVELTEGGYSWATMNVNTDSDAKVELYNQSTSYVDFYIAGWWTKGTYIEKYQTISPGADAAWTEVSLSGYGVNEGDVCEILFGNTTTSSANWVGIRTSGSTNDRRIRIHEENESTEWASMFVEAGPDGIVEIYEEDDSDTICRLIGYWSENPGFFTELSGIHIGSEENLWQDAYPSWYGVPPGAVVHTLMGNYSTGSSRSLGIEASGSAGNRNVSVGNRHDADGANWVGWHTTVSGAIIQVYSQEADDTEHLMMSYFWATSAEEQGMYLYLHGPEVDNLPLYIGGEPESISGITIYQQIDADVVSWNDGTTSWQEKDLSGAPFNVPPNAVVEVSVANTYNSSWGYGGIRSVGETHDRRFYFRQDGPDSATMHCQVDENSKLEHYAQSPGGASYVYFRLLGYWTNGEYVDKFESLGAIGADAAWTPISLAGYGITDGTICDLLTNNNDSSNSLEAGVRASGSTLDRKVLIDEKTDEPKYLCLFAEAIGPSGAVEIYEEDDSAQSSYLMGYWSTPPGEYTELFGQLGGPTGFIAAWADDDLGIHGVWKNSAAQILAGNTRTAGLNALATRYKGSTSDDREVDVGQTYGSGINPLSMHCMATSGAFIQTTAGHEDPCEFYVMGFFWSPPSTSGELDLFTEGVGASESGMGLYIAGLEPGDILFRENFATWQPTTADAWETKDLAVEPFNVPYGSVVEIAIVNDHASNDHWCGVRQPGSSLDRRFKINEADGGGEIALTMTCQTASGSQIETYAEAPTGDISFVLLGYWTSGTYVEKMEIWDTTVEITWQDKDLSPYGVGGNQIAETVLEHVINGDCELGIRKKGSSLDRKINISAGFNGRMSFSTFVETDSSGTIQHYAQYDTGLSNFYLIGYWSDLPASYIELATTIPQSSPYDTWNAEDISSYGPKADSVLDISAMNVHTGTEYYAGVRASGSTLDRRFQLRNARLGGSTLARISTLAVSGSVVSEFYSNSSSSDFQLMGYFYDIPTAESGMDLYCLGHELASGELDSFVYGFETETSGSPLTIIGHEPTESGMPLSIRVLEANNIDIFVTGHELESSGIHLYEFGYGFEASGMPLFLKVLAYSEIPLFTEGMIPASGGIDLFTIGHESPSGDIDLFTYGYDDETASLDLVETGHEPSTSGMDLFEGGLGVATDNIPLIIMVAYDDGLHLFINGTEPLSSGLDLYERGHTIHSGSLDLFEYGHTIESGSCDLYIPGQYDGDGMDMVVFNQIMLNDLNLMVMVGVSGGTDLFIQGHTQFEGFAAVEGNNPSGELDLFVYAVPSGTSGVFYTNENMDLFISDDGSDPSGTGAWGAFAKVGSSGTHEDAWSAFAKIGNTSSGVIPLFMRAHASGAAPSYTPSSDVSTLFIEGSGDLASDGYFPFSSNEYAFARVQSGVLQGLDLFMSGYIAPIGELDMYVFGISGVQSGYVDLFVEGRGGSPSGNVHLYLEGYPIAEASGFIPIYVHGF